MTDTSPAAATDWQAQAEARDRLAAEARLVNRNTLFDALARASIDTVTVHFDGYADEGQITDVAARAGERQVRLPRDTIDMAVPLPDGSGVDRQAMPLAEAVEALVYDALEVTHEGWEDGDGAFGDIVFDTARRRIWLDYDERYTATTHHEHEL